MESLKNIKVQEDSLNKSQIDFENPFIYETDLENYSKRIEIDLCICLALVNYEWNEWQISIDFFNQANQVSHYFILN